MSHWLRRALVLVLLAIGLPSALAAAAAGDTPTLDRPTATQGAKVDGSTLSSAFVAAFAWNGVEHLAGTTSLAGGVVRHAELDPDSGRLSNLTGTIGTTSSGSFAYVWDHARATRRGRVASGSLTTGLAWDWQLDGALRLRSAVTSLPRQPLHRTWAYGLGDADELQSIVDSDGAALHITSGPFGRPEQIGDETLTYDHLGQRLEDRRFAYTWDWRGRLVQVDVKEDAGVVSEACGGSCDRHRVRYERDALGRLLTRIHEVPTDTGYQALSTRRFVWDGDTLVAEMALENDGRPLWKATHLPGPGGLDDTAVLRLDTNLTATPATAHLALVRDEMGSVIALARDAPDGGEPRLVARVLYTPYGEAHLELGPEPLTATYDPALTTLGGQSQQSPPPPQPGDPAPAVGGGVRLATTVAINPATLVAGIELTRLDPGAGTWEGLPPAALATAVDPATATVSLMPLAGWEKGRQYRVFFTTALKDASQRVLQVPLSEPAPWTAVRFEVRVAADGTVDAQERRWTPDYDSAAAAGSTLGGIMPGGTTTLFQGLWVDPVTGQAHARARVLDTRHGVWLSEDPIDLDSPNLYAFVAWQPHMYTDPSGEFAYLESPWDVASLVVGTASLCYNASEGNVGAFAVDLAGVVVDAAAVLLPVPGGAGMAIKAARAGRGLNTARRVVEAGQVGNQVINLAQAGVGAQEAFASGHYGWGVFNLSMGGLGIRQLHANPWKIRPDLSSANMGLGGVRFRYTSRTEVLVRHRAGNMQVRHLGARWNTPTRDISVLPSLDELGDYIQGLADKYAGAFSFRPTLTQAEKLVRLRSSGSGRMATFLEARWAAQAKGRFVDAMVKRDLAVSHPHLQLNATGVDIVGDGIGYELLYGSASNIHAHAMRMPSNLFRYIEFR